MGLCKGQKPGLTGLIPGHYTIQILRHNVNIILRKQTTPVNKTATESSLPVFSMERMTFQYCKELRTASVCLLMWQMTMTLHMID